MPGSAAPAGSRTAPKTEYSGSRLSLRLNRLSYSAASMTCPWPPRVALVQHQQHAQRAVQAGDGVAQRQAGAHRRAARLAVQRRPAIASPMAAKPGSRALGPVWP